jgi:hypothetical protein
MNRVSAESADEIIDYDRRKNEVIDQDDIKKRKRI